MSELEKRKIQQIKQKLARLCRCTLHKVVAPSVKPWEQIRKIWNFLNNK